MALYNIAERLSTAKELISRGDDASLIYAALELRFCLESVAYQNLAAYGEDVSTELAREWRPDQIIKMLAEIPSASMSGVRGKLDQSHPVRLRRGSARHQGPVPWDDLELVHAGLVLGEERAVWAEYEMVSLQRAADLTVVGRLRSEL
ncbi:MULTISPECIES: hypothetical protein [unclassified Stenotrophomonas]|uniref:hypothetical protein n=1 Tax=Stenotrophomonas TaxID=40323 RepID=UPI0006979279|nr:MULTISPECIES: hypothetical protein [unclassified Stenotrophomonas]MDG9765050.1 hypothetical protein [Stenotrophomonas sp. GD04064]